MKQLLVLFLVFAISILSYSENRNTGYMAYEENVVSHESGIGGPFFIYSFNKIHSLGSDTRKNTMMYGGKGSGYVDNNICIGGMGFGSGYGDNKQISFNYGFGGPFVEYIYSRGFWDISFAFPVLFGGYGKEIELKEYPGGERLIVDDGGFMMGLMPMLSFNIRIARWCKIGLVGTLLYSHDFDKNYIFSPGAGFQIMFGSFT